MGHILICQVCDLEGNHNHRILLKFYRSDRCLITGFRVNLIYSCIESIICSRLFAIQKHLLLDPEQTLHIESIRKLNVYVLYYRFLRVKMIRTRIKCDTCCIITIYRDHTVYIHSCIICETVIQRSGISLGICLTHIVSSRRQIGIFNRSAALSLNMNCLHIAIRDCC